MGYETLTKPGGLATFNNHHGYTEAILRGYRLGFLKDEGYRNVLQCETLDDVRLNLQETDYGNFLSDATQVTPSIIREKATEKMVNEFEYLRVESGKWRLLLVGLFVLLPPRDRLGVG